MPRDDQHLREAVEQVLRLRASEQTADAQTRAVLASAREYIESTVGPTVRPASAARLLGVSQTALKKWLDKREIASVSTLEGRTEIPFSELLDLLSDLERLDATESSRPLATVLRERRNADRLRDLSTILPRRRVRGHRVADLQALAYHRLVAERLDDRIAEDARRRLARWRATNRINSRWAEEWERILALPLPQLRKAISADTAAARELRQTSPFAGVLPEQERRQLLQTVETYARL